MVCGKKSGKAHDSIQRRTNLIAHIGEESLFQQISLLGLLTLHSQAMLHLHQICHIAAHTEIALHLTLIVKHGHHIEQKPHLATFLVANLNLYGLIDAMLGQVVHPVEHTRHCTTETRCCQSDAAQL